MKKTILTTVAALSMLCTFAQWKPVGDKIKTPWAEKVDPANVLPEYPRPQMVRSQWVNLNGLWDYAIKPAGAMEPKTMDGKILVPFAVESSLSGVQKGLTEKDELWYRRTFSVPAAWKGSNVLLNFGAVDWKADVFVNDILAGSHTGGFTPFSLDITPYLKAKGEQKLVVRVFDGTDKGYQPRGKQVLNPNGIWYTPVSGIWQTVWIEPVAKSHISGIKAIPNLDQKNIAVTVAAENCTTGDLASSWLRRRDFPEARCVWASPSRNSGAPTRRSSTTWKCRSGRAGKPSTRSIRTPPCARSEPSATRAASSA